MGGACLSSGVRRIIKAVEPTKADGFFVRKLIHPRESFPNAECRIDSPCQSRCMSPHSRVLEIADDLTKVVFRQDSFFDLCNLMFVHLSLLIAILRPSKAHENSIP